MLQEPRHCHHSTSNAIVVPGKHQCSTLTFQVLAVRRHVALSLRGRNLVAHPKRAPPLAATIQAITTYGVVLPGYRFAGPVPIGMPPAKIGIQCDRLSRHAITVVECPPAHVATTIGRWHNPRWEAWDVTCHVGRLLMLPWLPCSARRGCLLGS